MKGKKIEKMEIQKIVRRKNIEKILEILSISNSLSRYEISKLLGVDYRVIHRNMKTLEEMGLVEGEERRSENGDLRLKKIYKLTMLGEKVLKSILKEEMPNIARIYSHIGLSDELRKELEKWRKQNEG
jgi:predicted ArsR family transcriptional regulator